MVAAGVTTTAHPPTAAKAAPATWDRERHDQSYPLEKCLATARKPRTARIATAQAASIGDFVIIRCIGIAEFERSDDLLGWPLVTTENLIEHCAVNALSSGPRRLASRSSYLRAKQANHPLVVEYWLPVASGEQAGNG